MKNISLPGSTLIGVLAFVDVTVHADTFGSGSNTFSIPFVSVGNIGNVANSSTGYGAVSYSFEMSTYAVSQADINLAVADGFTNGSTGNWKGSQPATSNWYQAAAFVNWLNTSQGYAPAYNLIFGSQGSAALIDWSQSQAFSLGGGTYDLYRNANAHYFLPTENEYYKAAYYDPNANGGAGGYWQFATGSNTAPMAVASGTAQGAAVYNGVASQPAAVNQAGGLSPYGTMGQSGNVDEWMEDDYFGGYPSFSGDNNPTGGRTIRGGDWGDSAINLGEFSRGNGSPTDTDPGFRVVSVAGAPEPSSVVLMVGSSFAFLAFRRRPHFL